MKKPVKAAATVALGTTLLMAVQDSNANFADDWVSQTSGTAPGYFSGSQRGYVTGGSFSARWPQNNDHLLSISKPRLKAGCGGIDMFLGGFSFLNVDYLVQKLQRVLSAAPAAAFDIALKTLAPQVSDTIKSLETITDKLNNLQLDDCKASKALVGVAAGPFVDGAMKAEMDAAKADFMQSSGVNDLWQAGKTLIQSEQKSGGISATSKTAATGATSGCPAKIVAMFGTDGSVLEKLGDEKGIPAAHINLFRGYIGDAFVHAPSAGSDDFEAEYHPPCAESTFEGLIDGSGQIRPAGGSCAANPAATANLITYVNGRLTSIASAIKNRTAITNADIQFMQTIPLPVWPALRAAVQTGTEPMMISKLSDISAKGLAYMMMIDMATRVRDLIEFANHVKSTQKGANAGQAPETCQMAMFEKPFKDFEKLGVTAATKSTEAYQQFAASASDAAAVETLMTSLKTFNDISRKEIAQRFSAGVANRALRGS